MTTNKWTANINFVYGTFIDNNLKYSVNILGDVYDHSSNKPVIKIPYYEKTGYARYNICGKRYRGHTLVAQAFLGDRPENMLVRHLDGNPKNNNISNLCYGTHKENSNDMISHNRQSKGETRPLSKLTELEVIEIINLLKNSSMTQSEIAELYKVSRITICNINTGRRWNYLTRKGGVLT